MNPQSPLSPTLLQRCLLAAALVPVAACGGDTSAPSPAPSSTPPAAPTLLGLSPASPNSSQSVALDGTAQPNADILVYASTDCTGIQLGIAQAGEDGTFALMVAVPKNTETSISAAAKVDEGPTSPCSASLTYLHDDIAPEASVSQVVDAVDVDGEALVGTETAVIHVTASDTGSGVMSVRAISGDAAVDGTLLASGDWELEVPLASEGSNTITITATDGVGIATELSTRVMRDTIPPNCSISPLASATSFFDNRYWFSAAGDVTITGTSEDASAVSVTLLADSGPLGTNTATAVVDGAAGTWTGSVITSDGTTAVTATCTDAFGYQTEAKIFIEVDVNEPVVVIGSSQFTSENLVSVTVSESGAPIFDYGATAPTQFPEDCLAGDPMGFGDMDCSASYSKVISRMTLADDGHPSDDNLLYFVAQPVDDSAMPWQDLAVDFQLEADEAIVSPWQPAVSSETDSGYLVIVAAPFYDILGTDNKVAPVPDSIRVRVTDKAGNTAERVIKIRLTLRPPPLIFEPVTEWTIAPWDAASIPMRQVDGLVSVLGSGIPDNVAVNNAGGMRIGRYRIRNPHDIAVKTRVDWGKMTIEATYQEAYISIADGTSQVCGNFCTVNNACRYTNDGQLVAGCVDELPGPSNGIFAADEFGTLKTAWATEDDLASTAVPDTDVPGFDPFTIAPQSSVIVDHLVPALQYVIEVSIIGETWYEMADKADQLTAWCRSESTGMFGSSCFDNRYTVPRAITSITLTTPSTPSVQLFEGVDEIPSATDAPAWVIRNVAMPSSHTWTAPAQ